MFKLKKANVGCKLIKMIEEEFHDLFLDKHVASVATINPDGSPQVTPMWIDYDKERNLILVNTAKGRKKARNMFQGAKVAINILDKTNPYRYIAIQGEVAQVTEDGAQEHINRLSERYFNRPEYPLYEGEIRIIVKIKPKYVHVSKG